MFEKVVTSTTKNIISSCSKHFAGKFKLYLKRRAIKKKLKNKIFEDILKDCGNQPYYNSLDSFLTNQRFTDTVIAYCFYPASTPLGSLHTYLSYISNKFVESNSGYMMYESYIRQHIYALSKIAFEVVNDYSQDETARLVITQIKEDIQDKHNELKNQNDEILKILKERLPASTTNVDFNNTDTIKLYKSSLISYYVFEKPYISRNIYTNSDDAQSSCTCLLENKRIVLLGSPGCGKTYETINVLKEICTNTIFQTQIPIYIKLMEYGIAYNSLSECIRIQLKAWYGDISDQQLYQGLSSDTFVLILDGVDEILDAQLRVKFFADINQILTSSNAYCFITSRTNPYHGDVKNIKEYRLNDLSQEQIECELENNGVYTSFSKQYIDLFSTPLFLQIGIKVLQACGKNKIYNKSQLFNAYIEEVCYRRDQEKQLPSSYDKNYFNILMSVGQLAFECFGKISLTIAEFDQFFGMKNKKYTVRNICDVFRIDVFKIGSNITFSHKQFKEFFAAYYLVKKYDITKNEDLYKSLMGQEIWQEVMVFAAGLIDDIYKQNMFLDMILKINLKTYISCVKHKNDFSNEYVQLSHDDYANIYLKMIHSSYRMILDTYFPKISHLFEPSVGKEPYLLENKKVCIVGNFSTDRAHLHYWFDWKDMQEDTVQLLADEDSSEAFRDMEHRAVIERRNIQTRALSLDWSELTQDSARQIALDIVYKNIEDILKKCELFDSDYILYEKLCCEIESIKELKGKSILEIASWANNYIADILKNRDTSIGGTLVGIVYNRADVFNIANISNFLANKNRTSQELALPGPDLPFKNGWIWEVYSKERVAERLKTFFLYKQESFNEMVENNFPKMKDYFPLCKDYPYKYVIHLEYKNGEDFASQPSIIYYHIAVRENDSVVPEIIIDSSLPNMYDDDLRNLIINSYIQNGKEGKNITITNTGFDMTLHERISGANLPLASAVYGDLRDNFNSLFKK